MKTDFPGGVEPFEAIERPNSDELDNILGVPFGVLDHGFIRVIDYMGDEAAIVQAARVSYGKGTKAVSEDRGLIRYLLSHSHTTPFEMCELKLHVKLPIYVARQWVRHRTANINEYSARYSILKSEFQIPEHDDLKPQSTTNKQGRAGSYSSSDVRILESVIQDAVQHCADAYEGMTDETGYNLARETARIVLPLNTYTEWYWKIDLHNLLHFLRLRADPHAQQEIRDYANVICDIVRGWMPNVWEAFKDYQLEGMKLSRMEIEALYRYVTTLREEIVEETSLAGVGFTHSRSDGLSTRERADFEKKLMRMGIHVE